MKLINRPHSNREARMNALINRSIILGSRPQGEPLLENFQLVESPVPRLRDNEVLLQTIWLSLDPYMRGHMDEGESYSPRVKLGEPMKADTVSRVIRSNHPDFSIGDFIEGYTFWQEYTVSDGDGLRKIDPNLAPLSTALGVLGMPGMTAYTGLLNIGQPKPGETLVVAAASGPVGSLVGQIGKRMGCKVVGIAGGAEKCRFIRNELGFDSAIDHRDPALPQLLTKACPNGIDIYFENVGGHVWNAVFPLLNKFARVPVCGLVAHYSDVGLPPGPDHVPELMDAILVKRLTLRGFIVEDFNPQAEEFRREVALWLSKGEITYKEDIVEGLQRAPERFIGMLKGRNFGKTLIRISAI
jgi:NADPH-dependent curcumin reductase